MAWDTWEAGGFSCGCKWRLGLSGCKSRKQ